MSHSETYTDTGPTSAFYQGVEAGEKSERERIIKLMETAILQETRLLDFNSNRSDFKFHHAKITIAQQFIDLIKGEQK